MPPCAAFECDRTGWTLERMATDAPSAAADRAARWPARPAPITSTSCSGMKAAAILCDEVSHVPVHLVVPEVARRAPEGVRMLLPVAHERRDPAGAVGAEKILGRAHEREGDPLAAAVGRHRQPVHVRPPA